MITTQTAVEVGRRVGEAQDWALPTRLDDPLLGLGYEQLTELWRDTGLPEGWDRALAVQVAQATHAVISRQIGLMSGERVRWGGVAAALAGLALAERYDEGDEDEEGVLLPTPFEELAEVREQLQADRTVGWGSGAGALRRLYEYNELSGPFEGRDKRGRAMTWGLRNAADFEPLDRACARAARQQKSRATLPVPACTAFAPPERTISVAGVVGEVKLPSVWQFVATMLVWGADEARARVAEWLNEEAVREVAPRVDRPEAGRLAHGSLKAKASCAHSWLLRAHEVAPAYPLLAARWATRPKQVSLMELEETVETWRADRTAVPLLSYRRKRKELIDAVEAHRRRDGTLDPTCVLIALKRLVLFLLLGETSARIGEIARICHASLQDDFRLGGYATPVVVINISKRGRRVGGVRQQIKPITPETARYFRELMALCGIPADDTEPIWMSHFAYSPEDEGRYAVENRRTGPRMRPSGLSGALVRSRKGRIEPLLARPTGRGGFSAHSFRHLGEQLAFRVGAAWLDKRKELQTLVNPQVFCDAQLGHQMSDDKLGYKDLDDNRDLWVLRTALGDRNAEIPGLLDLLAGDAGARRGWDIDVIRGVTIRHRIARQRESTATGELSALRLQRRAVREQPLPPAPTRRDRLTSKQIQQLMLDRDIAREEREHARDMLDEQIEQAHEALDAARIETSRLAAELAVIRQRGRTHPLPDDLPAADELPVEEPSMRPLDEESWEDALTRADVQLELLALEPEPVSTRVRHRLNVAEFGAVLGITSGALRKRLRGEHEPFFALDGPESPMIVIGDRATSKLRFIDTEKLPNSFLRRLLPEQREMIEQLLAVPMGSTRWGGRAHDLSSDPSSG